MKRILLALVLFLVLIVGLAWIFLNPLVKGVVQKGATYATGVETTVDAVDAGVFAGKFGLSRLSIANPEGFRPEPFLRLDQVGAAWKNGSIFSDTLEIDELRLDGVELNFERQNGRTNLGRITDNLKKLSSKEPGPTAPPKSTDKQRTLIVKHILIQNVKASVHLSELPIASNSLSVNVPKIELQDFRTDGDMAENIAKLTATLVEVIATSTLNEGQGIIPKDMLDELGGNLKGLKTQAKDLLKDVGGTLDGLKGLLKK